MYYVHDIDPFLIRFSDPIGPLQGIPWYGLSYWVAIMLCFVLLEKLRKEGFLPLKSKDETESLVLFHIAVGVFVGGRFGHILFYEPHMLANPASLFTVWKGGMASHGGFLGVILGILYFCKKKKYSVWRIFDGTAIAASLGFGFGRFANFINGEMPGKVTDVPWAVIFPKFDPYPRHPAQLYQSLGEGFLLFLILYFFVSRKNSKPGLHFSLYISLYALQRLITEYFRAPSEVLSSSVSFLTQGQVLSILMFGLGCYFLLPYSNED